VGYILHYKNYISYLHFLWAKYKWSNLVRLLDYQQKIDMGLMSGNLFDPLGDNENPNRFKTWGTIMVPKTSNHKKISPLPIWRENEGTKKNKEIWFRKVIKPIVRDCSSDSAVFAWSIMDPNISKILLDNLTWCIPAGYWYFIRIPLKF